jgi:hypothetical protein
MNSLSGHAGISRGNEPPCDRVADNFYVAIYNLYAGMLDDDSQVKGQDHGLGGVWVRGIWGNYISVKMRRGYENKNK